MATPLGGSGYNGVTFSVYNASASTITRGMVVAHNSVAANNPAVTFLDITRTKDYGSGTEQNIDVALLSVKAGVDDTTGDGANSNIGVALHDILPGKQGVIMVFGCCKVKAGGSITVGEVMASGASGVVVDAANAADQNPLGYALETMAANDVKWAFVNFLSAVIGCGAAGNNFNGKAF